MKKLYKLKLILKRLPKLYGLFVKTYILFRGIRYKLEGTKLEENYWANKQDDIWDNSETNDWIRDIWDSQNHSHRTILLEKIFKYSPQSILEVGCCCGPNLNLLAKMLPNTSIRGIDINPQAVKKGNKWLAQEKKSNVELILGKADDLQQFQNKNFDVVFTDAVLMYVGPDKIKKVINELLRVSRKALVLLEWQDFNATYNPLGKNIHHWVRDYKTLLQEIAPEAHVIISKLPDDLWEDKNWKKHGAAIEIYMDGR